MVEWAGLEIRSLSQDRGFESLSLLETKRVPFGGPFCFIEKMGVENPRRGVDSRDLFNPNMFHAVADFH